MDRWIKDWLARRGAPPRALVTGIFIRGVGIIYFAAFLSLWVQVRGLAGRDGILPAADYLAAIEQQANGWAAVRQFPTFCWISASDASLLWQCGAGTFLAMLLAAGFAPRLLAFLLWALWLSLCTACQDFLGFQWENLLLESGFLAVFLAPGGLLLRSKQPPFGVLWLFWWLLFRLMFMSGMVKLLSGDPSWRDFTALFYHYETQPLPTVFGWYSHHLPHAVLKAQAAVMYVIELALPFLILCGRRARAVVCAGFVLLQLSIAFTGNYCYFNFLTILLCLLLLDDHQLRRVMPRRWRPLPPALSEGQISPPSRSVRERIWISITTACSVAIVILSLAETIAGIGLARSFPPGILALYRYAQPFRSVNSYGLFAVMTKERDEIIIEGSDDGEHWKAYEFRYKPGALNRMPGFVAPHQPRLDWQMWFAALGSARENPWFVNFCVRLLQGKRAVLALLKENPFPDRPPKYIHALSYRYDFTSRAELRKTGRWWKREFKSIYLPAISLNEPAAP